MTAKILLQTAAVSGVLCVIIGAFGAHKLKPVLSDVMLNAYEKGVQYQFYHTLALVGVALLIKNFPEVNFSYASVFFIAGIILFSGSLYGLALTSIKGESLKFLGPITPIGGLCFIAGWIMLFISISKIK
ncbi:MAG TPA: DUF423 domain-containing protein [Bacteroidia bacterium]|nr:DUF423 domain-containing protein [Bacteroidia bacterium]HNU34875.1 DUF423 domain-containing protein [Bacteroidia bacterium]